MSALIASLRTRGLAAAAGLCLVLSVVSAGAARAEAPASSVNWPSFAGDGTFATSADGLSVIDDGGAAKVAWRLARPMGVQKSNAAQGDEFYGGTACVIAADGLVFTSYIRPAGDVLNEKRTNRYYPVEKQTRPMRQIDADDVTIAVDAETGKVVWTAEEKGESMNFLFGKRGHYGVTPACADGTVFTWGALGNIYAYDAKTGAKKWQARADAFYAKASAAKKQAMDERNILDTYGGAPLFEDLRTGLIVADGVLAAPDGFGGLLGFDAATGKPLWSLKAVIARGATPAIWRHEGEAYLLCPFGDKNDGKVSLIAPADGKVLWTHTHAGPAHTSLVVGGDRVLFNTRGNMLTGQKGPQGDKKLGSGLLACYELSLAGPKPLWTLEDVAENWHDIRPDRGMNRRIAIRGDVGYLLLGEKQRLAAVDMKTGKVIQRDAREVSGTACSPVVVGSTLLFPLDVAHSWGGVKLAVYALKPDGTFEQRADLDLAGKLKVEVVTDYEVANEFAWYKGRFFAKTRDGMACVDVRK
jgi:outer membrane protein assembly factor BamB